MKNSLSYRLRNTKFNYAKNLKYFIIAPICIALIGIVLLFTIGFNKGIDFTGGSIINVVLGEQLEQTAYYNESVGKIEEVLNNNGLKASLYQLSETDNGLAISVRYQNINGISEEEMNDINANVREELFITFELDPNASEEANLIQDSQRIGATASSELLMNAFISILVVIVVILIYIAIRFELTSGLASVLALFHDVIMMASLMLIFRIEINSSFIAAMITIIGYSINNTILIFDRIRENAKNEIYSKTDNATIANISINETMSRSIFTNLTTLLSIVSVAAIGVPSIRLFALPIIFGLIAGAYSSVFIAPGLWAIAYRKKNKVKKQQKVTVEEN